MSFSKCREVNLGDVCEFQEGYVNPSQKVPDYFGNEIKWVRANDLNNGYVYDTSRKLSKKGFDSAGKSALLFEPDSIVISKSGTIGRLGIIKDYMCGNRATINIKTKKDFADYKYIFYYLLSNQTEIADMGVGSVQKNLYTSILEVMPLSLPVLPEQKAIAVTLSCLDDMIELNNRTNQILEEMAQAIFKHWFVDFQFPNEDGQQPYKSSGGEMVDSDLGEIPKGWKVCALADIIDVRDGTHDSPKPIENGFPLVTSKHLIPYGVNFKDTYSISESDYLTINQRSIVEPYDILISMIGTVGNISYIMYDTVNFAIKNVGLFKTSSKQDLSEFILLYLKSDFITNYIFSRLAGSTQKYISLNELRKLPFILPDDKSLLAFKVLIEPMFKQIKNNENQSGVLLSIRDTLLPKLMSGKIRVPIEEVV